VFCVGLSKVFIDVTQHHYSTTHQVKNHSHEAFAHRLFFHAKPSKHNQAKNAKCKVTVTWDDVANRHFANCQLINKSTI
jgi:hypothetical protein